MGVDIDMQVVKEVTSNILLFMLLFGMSATVDFRALVHQLKNKHAIGSGIIMQYLFMPLLGFASVMMLGDRLHPAVGITLLVVTSSPGGSYSNLMCNLANADLPLSVAMTALSTILSVVMLPANLLLYSKLAYGTGESETTTTSNGNGDKEDASALLNSINWGTLFITLGIVLAAILSGLYASYRLHSKRFRRWCNRMGSISGVLLIVVSAVISSGNPETRLWNKDWAFYVGVAFPAVVGLFLANIAAVMAGLKKPEVVTVAVECCYQNVGIATSVALSMFNDPVLQGNALCVPMFYGLLEAVLLSIYVAIAWKLGWTKAPPGENLCVVLGTTYEVAGDDDENDNTDDTPNGNHEQEDNEDDNTAATDLELAQNVTPRKAEPKKDGNGTPLYRDRLGTASLSEDEDDFFDNHNGNTTNTSNSNTPLKKCTVVALGGKDATTLTCTHRIASSDSLEYDTGAADANNNNYDDSTFRLPSRASPTPSPVGNRARLYSKEPLMSPVQEDY
jgi:predicted Na+-dependent transporter